MKLAHSIREVATLLGASAEKVRAIVTLIWGEPRDVLSAHDVVLVRTAAGLITRKVSRARLARALERTRAHLASNSLALEGAELVAGEGPSRWNAETGQRLLDFQQPTRAATWLRPPTHEPSPLARADTLFARAAALERDDDPSAVDTYAQAVAANPRHADAHVNLGRLLHQRGRHAEAEAHYVAALVARPNDATATFNLAVVLDDQGRLDEAIARYHEALALEPGCVDAYFNLARLYERKGEKLAAIRHLKDYRRLSQSSA